MVKVYIKNNDVNVRPKAADTSEVPDLHRLFKACSSNTLQVAQLAVHCFVSLFVVTVGGSVRLFRLLSLVGL